jgi:bacteriorhodopsin
MEAFLLWIGVLGFLAATAYFAYLGTQAPPGSQYFFIITTAITAIAAFSYLMMATGAGSVLIESRIFYYFRYVDWVFTTPLLLLNLALLALADVRRQLNLVIGLVVLDVFMVLTGWLAGSRISGFGRGFWFLVSVAALIAVLYLVVTRLFPAAQNKSQSVQGLFRRLAILTVVVWSLYPIVWLIGTEGFGAVGSTTQVFLILILDFLAMIGFGLLLLTDRQALSDAGAAAVRPSRVR